MKVIFDKIDASNLEREFSFYTKVIDSKYISKLLSFDLQSQLNENHLESIV